MFKNFIFVKFYLPLLIDKKKNKIFFLLNCNKKKHLKINYFNKILY